MSRGVSLSASVAFRLLPRPFPSYASSAVAFPCLIAQGSPGSFRFCRDDRTFLYVGKQEVEHRERAVLSPLLFNLAMMNLPFLLQEVEGVHHTLYADDITIWTNTGSPAQIEERLQEAALLVDTYATSCGPISLPSGPVPLIQDFRIIGLHLSSALYPQGTISSLRRTSEQVTRCPLRDRVPPVGSSVCDQSGPPCLTLLWPTSSPRTPARYSSPLRVEARAGPSHRHFQSPLCGPGGAQLLRGVAGSPSRHPTQSSVVDAFRAPPATQTLSQHNL
ncbi:hypothetical protein HPB52_022010 [Rhipicephalus sanguineus]|uniref:Tick transposon n=1 Tax=Rhipicephalus sanguineus TaxID=34632 RepID=A0A9D4PTN9_RHISA|nr:hypothetical protein HPB52_022010 [Rhipicephalus sanguineus]